MEEALSVLDNQAMIRVLKGNIASTKWSDEDENVQATMSTLLQDEEMDTECSCHDDYELRVIEYMYKMTKYLECKSVSEMKTDSSACVPQSCPKVQVKLPKMDLPPPPHFVETCYVGGLITSRSMSPLLIIQP